MMDLGRPEYYVCAYRTNVDYRFDTMRCDADICCCFAVVELIEVGF
jgi:hypothetical protein